MRKDRIARRTVSPTASGKGVGVVTPSLLILNDRLVFLDVKGDLSAPDVKGSDHG